MEERQAVTDEIREETGGRLIVNVILRMRILMRRWIGKEQKAQGLQDKIEKLKRPRQPKHGEPPIETLKRRLMLHVESNGCICARHIRDIYETYFRPLRDVCQEKNASKMKK